MNTLAYPGRQLLWDRCGAWASSACAVHCLVSPFLFLALPAFAKIWAHPASHVLMAIAVVPLALTVVVHGYRRHREHWVLGAALVGIAFILVATALPYLSGETASATDGACTSCCPNVVSDGTGDSRLSFPPASLASIVGSVFLVAAHFGNRRGCRGCSHPAP